MSEELQETEVSTSEAVITESTDNTEVVSDSVPDSDPQHEPNEGDGVQKRMNKLTERYYGEKQAKDNLQKEVDRLKASQPVGDIPAATPQAENDILPPSPDGYYEDPEKYNREMDAYQQSIANKAIQSQQNATIETDRQNQLQVDAVKAHDDYLSKAKVSGIDPDDALKSAEILVDRGISPDLSGALAGHEKAPALIDHLAKNPADFEELSNMTNPILIGRKLDKIEATVIQKNISTAPDPIDILSGVGAKEADEFDRRFPNAVINTSR